ncbi:MAG TPA: hypothetical protein VFY10_05490 [Dehalococcoidia bacterium]|nr:hypothetical protein [Dehalococcoidia bacterium]
MVQVESPFSYHNGMGEQVEPAWNDSVRDAVKDFLTAFGESSSELAKAAEKFAADSQHRIDEASEKAERSASTSSEMAEAARQAAEEARVASESLRLSVNEAAERVRSEVQEAMDRALSESASVQETGQRVRQELQEHIDEMVARIEQSTSNSRAMLEAAQSATSEAQQAAAGVHERIATADASVSAAQAAAEEARQAAERTEQHLTTANAALSAAQEAAEASRQAAGLAEQASNAPTLGHDAHDLLERLEADYQLLTRLVQELHTRLASLTSVTVATPESQPTAAEPQAMHEPLASPSGWSVAEPAARPVSTEEAPAAMDEAPSVAPSGIAYDPARLEAEAPSTPVTVQPVSAVPAVTLQGRIQLAISPVPDFDRLLHLDGSLGKMGGVQSVTLADYAQEEVTFRVDLAGPVAASEFAHDLSNQAGVQAEVTSASESSLALRLG